MLPFPWTWNIYLKRISLTTKSNSMGRKWQIWEQGTSLFQDFYTCSYYKGNNICSQACQACKKQMALYSWNGHAHICTTIADFCNTCKKRLIFLWSHQTVISVKSKHFWSSVKRDHIFPHLMILCKKIFLMNIILWVYVFSCSKLQQNIEYIRPSLA